MIGHKRYFKNISIHRHHDLIFTHVDKSRKCSSDDIYAQIKRLY